MTLHKTGRALSQNEQKVLAVTQLNSRMPITNIAQATGLRAHTVRRVLGALKERNVIEPYLLINPHRLGLNDFCIFFNFTRSTGVTRNSALAALRASPYVAYCVELAGEYQYSASIFSSSVLAVETVLQELAALHSDNSINSTFALRVEWTLLSAPSFSERSRKMLTRPAPGASQSLDQLDRDFLHQFSRSADAPITIIARRLGVSEGTLRARLTKLSHSGVLVGIPYHVHWGNCDTLPMRAMLSLRSSTPVPAQNIFKKVRTDAEITDIVRCLGAWDVECNFRVATPPAAGETVQRLHGLFDGRVQQLRCASEIAVQVMHRFPESLLQPTN